MLYASYAKTMNLWSFLLTTVILNTSPYKEKTCDLLEDPSYKKLTRDPTKSIVHCTNTMINSSGLPDEFKKSLRQKALAAPRIYGLPKIHKEDIPLHPIVNIISSATYYLAKNYNPVSQEMWTHVKNSTEFVKIWDEISINQHNLLVRFEVIFLFTWVPIEETLELLKDEFPPRISNSSNMCLPPRFQFQREYYEQTEWLWVHLCCLP